MVRAANSIRVAPREILDVERFKFGEPLELGNTEPSSEMRRCRD